jgi:methionine synthase I (cobalamin-dependent)
LYFKNNSFKRQKSFVSFRRKKQLKKEIMKPTVKQIKEVLRTQNRTAIFKIHSQYLKAGGATTSVYAFICEYAPNQTVGSNATA